MVENMKIVRKLSLVLIFICLFVGVASAVTYSSYNSNMSTTYDNYFKGIVSQLGKDDRYIYFRSSQYVYVFAYGKLALNGSAITGQASVISIDTSSSSYVVSRSTDNSFRYNIGSYMFYTDLGSPYSELQGVQRNYEKNIIPLTVAVCFVVFIVNDIYFYYRKSGYAKPSGFDSARTE